MRDRSISFLHTCSCWSIQASDHAAQAPARWKCQGLMLRLKRRWPSTQPASSCPPPLQMHSTEVAVLKGQRPFSQTVTSSKAA